MKTWLCALLCCLPLAGCGSSPSPSTAPPVIGGASGESFEVTSARMGSEGWEAMSAYGDLISSIGGRSRSLTQATKLYNNQGACLSLPGDDAQAEAVRRSCVADFSFGRRRLNIEDCINGSKASPTMNAKICMTQALKSSALAAQKATTAAQTLADTVKPGSCQELFTAWASENERMAIALTDVQADLVKSRSIFTAGRDAAAASVRVSSRVGLGGTERLNTACRPT